MKMKAMRRSAVSATENDIRGMDGWRGGGRGEGEKIAEVGGQVKN
jgi:hypothetical protein